MRDKSPFRINDLIISGFVSISSFDSVVVMLILYLLILSPSFCTEEGKTGAYNMRLS
jgi:hypothetical protein